jgi:hypothetical protein
LRIFLIPIRIAITKKKKEREKEKKTHKEQQILARMKEKGTFTLLVEV